MPLAVAQVTVKRTATAMKHVSDPCMKTFTPFNTGIMSNSMAGTVSSRCFVVLFILLNTWRHLSRQGAGRRWEADPQQMPGTVSGGP